MSLFFVIIIFKLTLYVYVCVRMHLVSASILHDLSDMQPQINAIKIEHPPYYCSSYTPPSAASAADHAQPAASFSKFQNHYTSLSLSLSLSFCSLFTSPNLFAFYLSTSSGASLLMLFRQSLSLPFPDGTSRVPRKALRGKFYHFVNSQLRNF